MMSPIPVRYLHLTFIVLALSRYAFATTESSDEEDGVSLASKRMKGSFNPMMLFRKLRLPLRGRTDRYRFLHIGLGKRANIPDTDRSFGTKTDRSFGPDADRTYEKRQAFTTGRLFGGSPFVSSVPGPVDQNMDSVTNYARTLWTFLRHANALLRKTEVYNRLRAFNEHHQLKRVPEEFSESLYPIQSGKQQLEVMLDKTMSKQQRQASATDTDEETMTSDDIDNSRGQETSYDELANILQTERSRMDNSETADRDLTGVFPSSDFNADIDIDEVANDSANDREDTRAVKNDALMAVSRRNKKWWAADTLNRFRSSKSSHSKSRHRAFSRVDPALYFIGLGR